MATLLTVNTAIQTPPEAINTNNSNIQLVNSEKVASDITLLPPAQQTNAVQIVNTVYLPYADYLLITVPDANTLYFTEQGYAVGATFVKLTGVPCP